MNKTRSIKKFMSYNGKAIYYTIVNDQVYYCVANGKGTDNFFSTYEEAMDYIDSLKK